MADSNLAQEQNPDTDGDSLSLYLQYAHLINHAVIAILCPICGVVVGSTYMVLSFLTMIDVLVTAAAVAAGGGLPHSSSSSATH